jgi:hypothetical protein
VWGDRPLKYLQLLQQWDGTVLKVRRKWFEAKLIDLTDETQPDLFAEMKIAAVKETDRDLLVPGGIFYWSIVKDQDDKVFSIIVFPRIPWTQEELDEAKRRAGELMEALGWKEPDESPQSKDG